MPTLHRRVSPSELSSARRRGRRIGGFTLVELIVVMTLIALLLTLAVPRYFGSLDKGRLTVQAQNIASVRDAIDKFYGDNGRYPDTLGDLVERRYLRTMPIDPVTEQSDWIIVAPSDTTLGQVYDVRSSARGDALARPATVPELPPLPQSGLPVNPLPAGTPGAAAAGSSGAVDLSGAIPAFEPGAPIKGLGR